MRPVPPRPAGGHSLHAGFGGGMGRSGQPVPAAACSTLCDGCGLWLGNGLLPVQPGGEAVVDLGLPPGHNAYEAERETQQGLWWTVDGILDTLGFVVLCVNLYGRGITCSMSVCGLKIPDS